MEAPEQVREAVRRFYDSETEREWARRERHRTEFAVSLRALRQHLPPAPARVLDCGGGPGRYAIELARLGYEVTLFDLSEANLAFAQERAAEGDVELAGFEAGTATDLSRFADASFDAVVLMGPLYHLLHEEERRAALGEAFRVLAPGGVLFAAFLTRYAVHRDASVRYPTEPVELSGLYEMIEQDGVLPPSPDYRFIAYFAHPDEIEPLVRGAGFEPEETLGAEGLVSILERYAVNALDGPAWDWWLEANWRAAHDPVLRGAVEHLLVVARRPRWRDVLQRFVARVEAAGIPYKVAGGTSAALYGLPVRVKDIDVETTAEGAYRIAELFEGRVVAPVALREDAEYRSHFGKLDIDGVMIEIIGDMERRMPGGWTPTFTLTEAWIESAGIRVRVPWLEEEFLANVRRNRLDRAALLLPRCDHARLMALLKGETRTNVI